MNDMIEKKMQTPIEIALGIDENGMTTAKRLYEFLEMHPASYARWFKRNILDNQFAEENVDFTRLNRPVESAVENGQVSYDAKLTAEFAKKLSMMQKTERGEEARKYFITVENKAKQFVIDRKSLPENMQIIYAMMDNQSQMYLEQKRQAEKIEKLESNQKALTDTFSTPSDNENFQSWVNKCITKIAESSSYDRGMGKQFNYANARKESYERLKKKWNCNLDDRVARAKGRAMERNPGITKAESNSINKLTIIANDKSLRPVYETVIKEMMIQYYVEVA